MLHGKNNVFYSFAYETGIVEHGDIPSLLEKEKLSNHHMITKIKEMTKKERA